MVASSSLPAQTTPKEPVPRRLIADLNPTLVAVGADSKGALASTIDALRQSASWRIASRQDSHGVATPLTAM